MADFRKSNNISGTPLLIKISLPSGKNTSFIKLTNCSFVAHSEQRTKKKVEN